MSAVQSTLPLVMARQRGHSAAQSAAEAATRIDPKWMDDAYKAFTTYVRLYADRTFTTEDIRKAATSVSMPADPRAWGAVALKAKRAGLIASVGYTPVESSNGSPKTLWKAVG